MGKTISVLKFLRGGGVALGKYGWNTYIGLFVSLEESNAKSEEC